MARLADFPSDIDIVNEKAFTKKAEEIRDEAKQLCPVDTGSLKRSIRVQKHARPRTSVHKVGVSAGGYVTNPKTDTKVNYAAYVEYGTSKSPAQPFMRPAIEKHKEDVARLLKKELRNRRR